jgi:hypothetical protein
MLLFVAAALAAIFLAPASSESASSARAHTAGTGAGAGTATAGTVTRLADTWRRERGDLRDPWASSPSGPAAMRLAGASLMAQAAALAADEVVDPWAVRPSAFGANQPIEVLTEPIDPWHRDNDAAHPATSDAPDPGSASARWRAAKRAAPSHRHSPAASTGTEKALLDPWNDDRQREARRSNASTSMTAGPGSPRQTANDVKDPWRQTGTPVVVTAAKRRSHEASPDTTTSAARLTRRRPQPVDVEMRDPWSKRGDGSR